MITTTSSFLYSAFYYKFIYHSYIRNFSSSIELFFNCISYFMIISQYLVISFTNKKLVIHYDNLPKFIFFNTFSVSLLPPLNHLHNSLTCLAILKNPIFFHKLF